MMIQPGETTPQQALRRVCEIYGFEPSTPLAHLSAEQQFMLVWAAKVGTPQPEPKEYLYGLRGLMQEFHVSHKTACFWASTWLKPAVEKRGKTILTDKELAHQLFAQRQEGKK